MATRVSSTCQRYALSERGRPAAIDQYRRCQHYWYTDATRSAIQAVE